MPRKLRLRLLVSLVLLGVGFGTVAPASARAASGDQVAVVSGDYQTVYPNAAFAPLVLKIVNAFGVPVANRSVLFEVLSGPASLGGRSYERKITGADGRVSLTSLTPTGLVGAISFRATGETPSAYFTFNVADPKIFAANGVQQVIAPNARFNGVTAEFGYANGYTRSGMLLNYTVSGPVTFRDGTRTLSARTNTYGQVNTQDLVPTLTSSTSTGFVTVTGPGVPRMVVTLKTVSRPVIRTTGSGTTVRPGRGITLRVYATDVDGVPVAKHTVTFRVVTNPGAVSILPDDGISTSSATGYNSLNVYGGSVTAPTTVTIRATSPFMDPVDFTVYVTP